jgi:predicted acylesterase/phospholipase RssA
MNEQNEIRARRRRRLVTLIAVIAAFLAWAWFCQSFHRLGQLAIDIAPLALGILAAWAWRRRAPRAALLLGLVVAWTLVSLLDPLLRPPLSVDPGRFARASRVRPERLIADGSAWRGRRLAVALSGGGYRAAAFHAGVLDALDRLHAPVTQLSTVSGGAIIGAFYANGGSPVAFSRALAGGEFNLRRQLALLPNALRLLTGDFDRLKVQAALLRRTLLHGSPPATASHSPGGPDLLVAATDLNFGLQVGFLEQGLLLAKSGDRFWLNFFPQVDGLEGLDLASKVAVSGAFPLAFTPRRVQIGIPGYLADPRAVRSRRRNLVLADGGIADNTGMELLRTIQSLETYDRPHPPGWRFDAVLVSDAGAVPGIKDSPGAFEAVSRAIDVMGARGVEALGAREANCRDVVGVTPHLNFVAFEGETRLMKTKEIGTVPGTVAGLPRYLPWDEVIELTGMSRSTLKRAIRDSAGERSVLCCHRREVTVHRLGRSKAVKSLPRCLPAIVGRGPLCWLLIPSSVLIVIRAAIERPPGAAHRKRGALAAAAAGRVRLNRSAHPP